jgi:TolB protein
MPAWSPNGDVIAFVSTDGSLAIAPSAGGPSSRVSLPQGLHASDPSWSPDSQSLAFGCNATNEFTRLCIVKRDGTGFRQLTDPTSDPAYHPAWSRDGNTIVFTSVSVVRSSIAVMPAAGGAIQILTEGFDPAWSRDGTKLVFARSDGLFTMNSDGSNVQRLTTGKHRAPAWRP